MLKYVYNAKWWGSVQQHQWQAKATNTQPREQKKKKRNNSHMERMNEAKQINILGILIACIVDEAKDGESRGDFRALKAFVV